MKAFLAATLVFSAAAAVAQVSTEEQPIQVALSQLRGKSEIMLELVGVDRVGSKVSSLYSTSFFKWDPLQKSGNVRAEVNDYFDSIATKRIVADGTTLWSYDFGRNSYTAFKYGSYNGSAPENARSEMLNELGATTQGPSVFLARLLREVYAGDVAQYRTWMPGAQVMTLASGSKKDPVNPERTYFASPNDCYVIYWYGSRITRSAAFHLVLNAKTGLWQLSEIYYSDKQDMASSSVRWVDWAITVYTDSLPKSTDYVFIPPRNSRGIANPRTSGGG